MSPFLLLMLMPMLLCEADYYKILNIKKSASAQEIKKSYRALSHKFHPDKNPSAEATAKFSEINNAYEILSD